MSEVGTWMCQKSIVRLISSSPFSYYMYQVKLDRNFAVLSIDEGSLFGVRT